MLVAFLAPVEHTDSAILREVNSETDFSKSRSITDVVKYFLTLFPEGFDTKEYLDLERNDKVAASSYLHECIGRPILEKMLADENYSEIWNRTKSVVQKTNLIFPQEKMALMDAIKTSPQIREKEFATVLFELLYGSAPLHSRFTDFTTILAKYGALRWTTATYFLFLEDPSKYAFMKPMVMDKAAEAFSYPLKRTKAVNWATYARLMEFYEYIKEYLTTNTPLKPVDMIDVQSFVWCADPRSYGTDGRAEVRENRKQRTESQK